ncbi:MAG: HAMP domain-containing sensor histidine kinase [Bdellovibrionota bacterium]|nr:HAMP domain-containing sensor histidine kinase [Bdellovibrionota bacterium]
MKRTSKLFLILSFLYAALLLALGSWWLYLIIQYSEKLEPFAGSKVAAMVKWEGATFFTLLVLLSASLLFLYIKDQKKTKGLQAFFASMTHELKTPLASIRLQTEVLKEELDDSKCDQRSTTLVNRLIQDTNKLETQMDKILQLSRLEGGGNLNLTQLNLLELCKNALKRWDIELEVTLDIKEDLEILGDEFAFNLILRNLFENTLNHSTQKRAKISAKEQGGQIALHYEDDGQFTGDTQKLGKLFYKHNSKKGSGIGLYLILKLTHKMKGSLTITTVPHMHYSFLFNKGDEF